MNRLRKKCAFSAVEVIVAVAILAILAGMMLGLGRRLITQAEDKLAQSTIDIIVLALEQYYVVNNDFPFEADVYIESIPSGFSTLELQNVIEQDKGAAFGDSIVTGNHEDEHSSSEALFYFLFKTPDCRRLIDTITDTQIANDGAKIVVTLPTGDVSIDLIRFIDPWGNALRYTYTAGDTFPLIESAGVDGSFSTAGDNISSK